MGEILIGSLRLVLILLNILMWACIAGLAVASAMWIWMVI